MVNNNQVEHGLQSEESVFKFYQSYFMFQWKLKEHTANYDVENLRCPKMAQ